MLTQARSSPNFANYLTYILGNGPMLQSLSLPRLPTDILQTARLSAAINLKNLLKSSYKTIDGSGIAYIKATSLACLEDGDGPVRSFAGTVITEVVQRGGILSWEELMPELLSIGNNERGNASPSTQESAMSALAKVCEDNKRDLIREYQGRRPLQYLIPKLLECTSSREARVRGLSLACVNSFIPSKPPTLIDSLDAILSCLFKLGNDPSDDVRRNVCRSFVLIVEVRPDKLEPHIEGLVEYMTVQQRNTDDPDLALEAAEFWLAVSENDGMCSKLGPYISKIVPVLLESMVYDEETIMRLEEENDDADVPDRPEDIKPKFAPPKPSAGERSSTNGANGQTDKAIALEDATNSDLEDGEVYEHGGDDDEGLTEDSWNLRKCSAATLDVLASNFHEAIFSIALPYLKENLSHPDWPNREAAVLAIGAVAEGCLHSIAPSLPDLVPYLISLLDDEEPPVKIITCWALGRYSGWASHLEDPTQKKRFFEPMMDGLLKRMLDKRKGVQESAASAFANLEEQAGTEVIPYCEPIIRTFVECFGKYKDKNMYILYDCVQTLAEKVGPALRQPGLVELLMPPLLGRWEKVADQSQEIFPLLECLSYVVTALGDSFAPFAVPIFSRCIRIIHQNLEQYLMSVQHAPIDAPDKDFLVTSIDLLSSLIQALAPVRAAELITTSQPPFYDLLMFCMEDPSDDVRQSSYALLGDCAVNSFPTLYPSLRTLIPVLVRQLVLTPYTNFDADTIFSVLNNACWSCGEIAIKYKQEMGPYVDDIYSNLMKITAHSLIPESVSENAMIALGRIGVECAQILAPRLSEFARPFLHHMEAVETNDEKCHAFVGFNRVVSENPQALEGCLAEYFQAAAWFKMDHQLTPEQDKLVGDSFSRVSSVHCPSYVPSTCI